MVESGRHSRGSHGSFVVINRPYSNVFSDFRVPFKRVFVVVLWWY